MSWGNKAWKIKSKLSNHIITINTAMQSLFFKSYTNVSYIPVGIDFDVFYPRERTYQIDDIPIKKDCFVIISVANMVPVKGIEVLIEAFLNFEKKVYTPSKLILVGDSQKEYKSKLQQQSKASQNIYFLGKKKDVRPYLAEADLFVIPTLDKGRKEGQGVATLEAMAMGIPVIASDLDGLRDVMNHAKDQLFEAGNTRQLEKLILDNFNCSKKEKKEVIRYNRKAIHKKFELKKVISRHQLLYQSL